MAEFQTIGVIGKLRDPRVARTVRALCKSLLARGCTVLVERGVAAEVKDRRIESVSRIALARRAQLAVVVGGDGTLLNAGRSLAPAGVPILGVNQGRLGFMVDVAPEDMQVTLDRILAGRYVREKRYLLSTEIVRGRGRQGPFLAINDVVLRNQAAVRMLEFETWIGRGDQWDFISQHRADGLIVSTPTGSTAYALSGGGPVLHPSLEALALVPICPHALSDRPVVVGSDKRVRIVLRGARNVRAMCTSDGQDNETVKPGDEVIISRSSAALELIHPENYRYFNILRKKLHWGRERAPSRPK